jgi:DUF4097 and DUF4098 domain-containing protein YvlB
MRRILTLAVVTLAFCALPAAADEWTKKFTVTGTAEVRLDAMDGNVRVTGTDSKVIEARVTTVGWRIAEDEVRVIDRQTGDRIEIEVKVPRWQGGWTGRRSIDIELSVPRNAKLDLHTGDGNISAPSLAGPAQFRTGDGNITVSGARGDIDVHTGDGNITATQLDGALDADTGDGNLVVDGRFDSLNLRTGDGNIEASARPGSQMKSLWNIRSGDGSVTLRLPDGFGAELDVHTGDGRISLEFPVTVSGKLSESAIRGKMNQGGSVLTIRTGDGPIRIEKL